MNTKINFHKLQPLTFRIIDSHMGIGKSASLIDLIRFHNSGFDPEPRRFMPACPKPGTTTPARTRPRPG